MCTQMIADDLEASQDPGLYTRCAEFFMQHGHFGKAVKMLIAAQQYTRALEMCIEQGVTISEVRRQEGKGCVFLRTTKQRRGFFHEMVHLECLRGCHSYSSL